jgi:DNA primase large subunit
MLSKIWSLMSEFELSKKNGKIYVDGANPSFIKSLKLQLGENPDYDKAIAYYKSQKWDWIQNMTVIPVSFTEHKAMLRHAKMIFEKGYVSINQDKLITSLRTAVENEGILDKVITSYDDIFDAFRLALRFYSLIGETPNEQH